jgi:hypothetical protein
MKRWWINILEYVLCEIKHVVWYVLFMFWTDVFIIIIWTSLLLHIMRCRFIIYMVNKMQRKILVFLSLCTKLLYYVFFISQLWCFNGKLFCENPAYVTDVQYTLVIEVFRCKKWAQTLI